MKKTLLLIVALITATIAFASVEINGIYYNLNDSNQTAEVTYQYYLYENNYSGVTSITIPEKVTYNSTEYSVTSIGEWAFYSCDALTSITIPNSVTSIGDYAFYETPLLNNQPDGCLYVGSCLYAYKGEMPANTHINVKEGTTQICCRSFYECSSLTSITIPNSVTSIGSSAFYNCLSLKSIQWNAKNYTDFTSYSDSPFYNIRDQITSFTFDDSIQYIPAYLCYLMKNLTSITVPNSVTYIGNEAFYGCSSLTSISIPNSVTSIGNGAFSGCYSVTSISIGNGITSIDDEMFLNFNKLRTIKLGNSIKTIGQNAFAGCTALYSIGVNAIIPPIVDPTTFTDVSRTAQIKVPCNAVAAYQSSNYWNKFSNYLESPYSLTVVSNDNTMGNAFIIKQPTCQDISAQVVAQALPGYEFVKWSDGFTENPHTIYVTSDTTITAEFRVISTPTPVENTSDNQTKIYTTNGTLHIEGATENYHILDAAGRLIYSGNATTLTLPRGIYLITMGGEVEKIVL